MKKKLLLAGLIGIGLGLCVGYSKGIMAEKQDDDFDELEHEISEPKEHEEATGLEMPEPKENEEAKELDVQKEINKNEDISDEELTDTLAEEADQKEVEADIER